MGLALVHFQKNMLLRVVTEKCFKDHFDNNSALCSYGTQTLDQKFPLYVLL